MAKEAQLGIYYLVKPGYFVFAVYCRYVVASLEAVK